MKKRQWKKLTTETVKVYRGILIQKNYMGTQSQSYNGYRVMVHLPKIECYCATISQARRIIDQAMYEYPEQFAPKEWPEGTDWHHGKEATVEQEWKDGELVRETRTYGG